MQFFLKNLAHKTAPLKKLLKDSNTSLLEETLSRSVCADGSE